MKNYYGILGISQYATVQDIKKAYKKMASAFHPNKYKSSYAAEKFQEIGEAFEVLLDPEKRALQKIHFSEHFDFRPFKCPECPFSSKGNKAFEKHITKNHPLSFVLFGKTSKNNNGNVKKPGNESANNKNAYTCGICEKSFLYHQNMITHIKTDHGVKKLFDCSLCHEKFTQIGNLNVHIKHCT